MARKGGKDEERESGERSRDNQSLPTNQPTVQQGMQGQIWS